MIPVPNSSQSTSTACEIAIKAGRPSIPDGAYIQPVTRVLSTSSAVSAARWVEAFCVVLLINAIVGRRTVGIRGVDEWSDRLWSIDCWLRSKLVETRGGVYVP